MKKKSKIAKYSQRRRKNPPSTNGALDFASKMGAGFAGYTGTRLLSRVVYSQIIKRSPSIAIHGHVLSSVLGAIGTYFGTKYWDKYKEFHEAATIGAGVAVVQSAIQAYIPKFGWVVSDVKESDYVTAKKKAQLPQEEAEHFENGNDDFLDELLAENPEIEAVPISSEVDEDDDYGDLENFNGMFN